jgi:hypothetical protein
MKKRWSIWVREHGSDHDTELIEMDGDTAPVIAKLRGMTLTVKKSIFEAGKRKSRLPKYTNVRAVENGR